MTREEAFVRFQAAARHVWRNADFVLPVTRLGTDPIQSKDAKAALLTIGGPPFAIGDSILRRAGVYALLLRDDLLTESEETIWGVLVHEAVHLGVPGHGKNFRALCVEKGGTVSGAGIGKASVILAERKVGARYRVEREFPATAEHEAVAWAREQAAAARARGTPERWRISFI